MVKRVAGHFFRYLWLVFALLVIVYALVVVAGRELLPVLNRYQPEINAYLSEKTGLDFRIRSLGGAWQGASPMLELNDVVVAGRGDNPTALAIDRLSAEISLVDSTANLTPMWRELTAGRIEINLMEDEQGRWNLGGYPLRMGAGDANLDQLLRMVYYSRLLYIDELVVDMHFYAGARARLYARDLRVENQGGFHRTVASIALSEEGENIADFVFEGRGDPAQPATFDGRGYLHLKRIDMEGSLRTLAAAWFPDLAEQFDHIDTDLDLSFWFDWRDSAIRQGRGHLAAAEMPVLLLPGAPPLTDLQADITGWFHPGEDWGFRVQGFTADWGDERVEPVDMQFRQRVGRHWGELDLAVNQVDLKLAASTLLNTNLLGEKGEEILNTLAPAGRLRQLFLDINFRQENPDFRVRANVEDMSVASWKGAPAVRGGRGYVESRLRQGFAILDAPDGFAMHYPQVYGDFMPYGHTRGKLAWRWQPERDLVLVTSNLIDIDGEEGQGKAMVHLELPTVAGGNPRMELMVGLKNSDTSFLSRYLPRILNPELSQWLRDAIGEGEIPEAGFIWRGSLKKENEGERSIQVYARLENGRVAYRQGWPEATDLAATLLVDNREMAARIASGTVAGAPFRDLGVNLRQRREGPLVRVVGNIDTDVATSFDVLSASPLAEELEAITALEASGEVGLHLDLRIPLSAKNGAEGSYLVNANLEAVQLVIPGTGYRIEKINGPIVYDHTEGVHSSGLEGRLWGRSLSARIHTDAEGTRIEGAATLGAEGLAALLGDADRWTEGETAVAAELLLPAARRGQARLTLSSTLEGLAVTLPAPFAKDAGETLESRLTLEVESDELLARGGIDDRLAVAIRLENGEIERGTIHLLADTAQLPPSAQLRVEGNLPVVEWNRWQPVLQGGGGEADSGAGSSTVGSGGITGWTAPTNLRLDLTAEDVTLGGFSLGRTRLRGLAEGRGGWLLNLESTSVAGEVVVSGGDAPPALRLDYVKLPGFGELENQIASGGDAGESLLEGLSPMDIPDLDVSIARLFVDGSPWGDIAFRSRSLAGGVRVTDIEGTLRNIVIKPQPLAAEGEELDPAQLQWIVTENGHSSFFSGTVEIEHIESVLAQWDIPAPFASERSSFYINLGWDAKPWRISTLKLDGYLGMELHDGQFYETRGSAANALFKLVGLINFDSWLRRLRFDFSDFFSEGLSFDKVEGGLVFRRGLVEFDEPVIASLSGGKVRLLGSADLVYDELDARLVVTMPVGTNLPWVAGLLGGLPAAAGVYLTSKLFEKQVDQLSSIAYRIRGSVDDPEIEVERIFTDPTKLSSQADNSGGK